MKTYKQFITETRELDEGLPKIFLLSQKLHVPAVAITINDEVYYIVPDKCTECKGFHEEPQCAAVCPVDCCVPDLNNIESTSHLLEKQKLMHS